MDQVNSIQDLSYLPQEEVEKLVFPEVSMKVTSEGKLVITSNVGMFRPDPQEIVEMFSLEYIQNPLNIEDSASDKPKLRTEDFIEGFNLVDFSSRKMEFKIKFRSPKKVSEYGNDKVTVSVVDHTKL